MEQIIERRLDEDKEFALEDALAKWREKVIELFPNQLWLVIYAGKHQELKESYIVQFELKCTCCARKSQQYQWLIQKNKICI